MKCPQIFGLPDNLRRPEEDDRLIEEVGGDEPELASHLRIEERELEAGGAELAPKDGEPPEGGSP